MAANLTGPGSTAWSLLNKPKTPDDWGTMLQQRFPSGVVGQIFNKAKSKAPDNWSTLLQQAMQTYNQPVSDPYSGQAQQWWNTVMAPGYQAYSPDQLDTMYKQQADKLKHDVFSQWEDTMAGRLANQGLAGSGVAKMDWENLMGQEGGALSQLRGDMWRYGQDATRGDVQQALGAYPTWQSMNYQNQSTQWNRIMDLLGVLGADKASKEQKQAANAGGLGNLIGTVLGSFLPF